MFTPNDLQKVLDRTGLTKSRFAAFANVSGDTVTRFLDGHELKPRTVHKIKKACLDYFPPRKNEYIVRVERQAA